MEIPPFAEAVARICARDRRYAPEAFFFLHDGLMRTLKQVQEKEKKPRQISGAELSEGLRAYALEQYGPLTMTVLERWGVRTTRDFGEIVFLLLEAGLLGKTEEDKIGTSTTSTTSTRPSAPPSGPSPPRAAPPAPPRRNPAPDRPRPFTRRGNTFSGGTQPGAGTGRDQGPTTRAAARWILPQIRS